MAAARALGRSPLLHALRDGPSAASDRGPAALRASLLALRALDDDDDDVRAAAAACLSPLVAPGRFGLHAAAVLQRGWRAAAAAFADDDAMADALFARIAGAPLGAPPVVEEAEADEAEGRALFAKEADNFHEEPLQQAQLAAALLRPLLLKRAGSEERRRGGGAGGKELSAALKAERAAPPQALRAPAADAFLRRRRLRLARARSSEEGEGDEEDGEDDEPPLGVAEVLL